MDTHTQGKRSDDHGVVFSGMNVTNVNPSGANPPAMKEPEMPTKSGAFDIERAFTSEHGDAGTIISDKKRTRPSFGQTMSSAFTEWWGNTSGKVSRVVEKAKEVRPVAEEEKVVAKAETRTAVIKEAARNTAMAPKDDHHEVIAQFRTLKGDSARITGAPAVMIKQATPKSTKGAWSHIVDDAQGKNLHERQKPETKPASIAPVVGKNIERGNEFKSATSSPSTPSWGHASDTATPMTQSASAPAPVPVRAVPPVATGYMAKDTIEVPPPTTPSPQVPVLEHVSAVRETPPPQPQTPPPTVEPESEPVELTWDDEEVPPVSDTFASDADEGPTLDDAFHGTEEESEVEELSMNDDAEAEATPSPLTDILSHDVVFRIILPLGAILIGATLAVMVSIYFNVFNSGSERETTATPSSFFATASHLEVPLGTNRSLFFTQTRAMIENAMDDTIEVMPTITDANGIHTTTSNEFFATLGTPLPPAMLRSLDERFMLGGITSPERTPFIIIRSYNFDALFAGLLAWEKTMQGDLAPLFGESDPAATFSDVVVDNRSRRVLSTSDGTEYIVYGFVDNHTVVITSSHNTFNALLEKF